MLDFLLRFSWVWYLAPDPPSVTIKGFGIAMMEVGRRVMWNAFRFVALPLFSSIAAVLTFARLQR